MRILALVLLAACQRAAPRTLEASLAAHDVAHWKLTPDEWRRVTTDPYRDYWKDYADAFDAAAPALAAQLSHAGAIATRAHYAGDPQLTLAQARTRWAQPIQAPSKVATLNGAPIDAVFVEIDGHWRAIVGVDAIIRAHTAALDPACAQLFDRLTPGACDDDLWVAAEAALRDDRDRFTHACALAANLCAQSRGTPRP